MRKFTSAEFRFVIYTYPKSACRTARAWFTGIQKGINKLDFSPEPNDPFNSDYYQFAVVRNPYTRVLSAFIDKISNPQNNEFFIFGHTFESWLYSLTNLDTIKFDPHWRPQYIPVEDVKLNRICKIESFQTDIDIISDDLKLPKIKISKNYHSDRYGKPWYEYYDDNSVDMVQKIYKKDFKRFDYNVLFEKVTKELI